MGRASRGARLAGASALLFSLVTVAVSHGAVSAAPEAAPAATTALPAKAMASAAGITFGRPTVSGIQGIGNEQDIRRDDTDPAHPIIYTSVPGSVSSGTSWIWRSLDNGKTFKWVPAATPKAGKVDTTCPGGGDTELAVDTAGHLYFNDLTLTNFSTSRSDDHGASFAPVSCTAVDTTPDDRQWYAVDGDPTQAADLAAGKPNSIYLNYDVVGGGGVVCGNSVSNNVLVMARSPLPGAEAAAGVQFAPAEPVTGVADPTTGCTEGIMGNNEVNPVTHEVFVVHDTEDFHQVRVGKCTPVDFSVKPSGLDCGTSGSNDKIVADLGTAVTGGNFPSLAIDKAGNLFVVWEQQARPDPNAATQNADTLLYWSRSSDDGNTWSAPALLSTPGLHNNVFAWAAAGDSGRVDIAWYGTDALSVPAPANSVTGCSNGPDAANGHWSLWMDQSLDFTSATPTFTGPVLASEHHINNSNIQTLIGGQCGDRALGDFLQLRIGPDGEANISYGDINNSSISPHAMVVRQNGGSGLLASAPIVSGPPGPTNSVTDVGGDGTYEANGTSSANQPNLDITGASVVRSDPSHYQVNIDVADLSSLAPDPSTGNPDTTLVWQVQWEVPSSTNPDGGEKYFAYMESTGGGAPTFWDGTQNVEAQGGGLTLTYPGQHQISGSVTPAVAGPGRISIDVPVGDVNVADPIGNGFFSVTASTLTYSQPPESAYTGTPIGGTVFNVIDVAPAFDFLPNGGSPGFGLPGGTVRGYWLVAADGGVFTFGNARFLGSTGNRPLNQPIVGMAPTPTGNGYWLVARDGGIFTFGDAQFQGSTGNRRLNRPIVGMATTPSGRGYWLVASDGGIFAFGDAPFLGSMGGTRLNQPIVGMATTPTGRGYWLVASDGGIFSFGDARFFGSMGGTRLNQPIVGMASSPSGGGYWMVASDGGIFTFGDSRFFGSTGNIVLNRPIVGMAATPDGGGYWMDATDGGIFTFGDGSFFGSMGGTPLTKPMVGMAASPG